MREIGAAAISQRAFTLVIACLIAGAAATTILTSGRSAATQEAVLRTIDDQGTRTVTIQAKRPDPGFSGDLVNAIAELPPVSRVIGFGAAIDGTAAGIPGGNRVGIRMAYGQIDSKELWKQSSVRELPEALVSHQAALAFGLPDGAGTFRIVNGREYQVVGTLHVPQFLESFEPLAIVRSASQPDRMASPLSVIVVLAKTPQDVALVRTLVNGFLADIPNDSVSISTSEELANLRTVVSGELTEQGRLIILCVLVLSSVVTFFSVLGFVLIRRKDFGRRRALGATRGYILVLVVGQIIATVFLGALLGAFGGLGWLWFSGGSVPSLDYAVAIIVALTLTAGLSAAIPGAIVANRDPLRELRVP